MSEPFRVLVCGGRDYNKEWIVFQELEALWNECGGCLVVIEGGARGADKAAAVWADAWAESREQACDGTFVVHVPFKANWRKYGRAAGPIRNAEMLTEGRPDLVLAFPGGSGTEHMVSIAQRAGVPVRRAGFGG